MYFKRPRLFYFCLGLRWKTTACFVLFFKWIKLRGHRAKTVLYSGLRLILQPLWLRNRSHRRRFINHALLHFLFWHPVWSWQLTVHLSLMCFFFLVWKSSENIWILDFGFLNTRLTFLDHFTINLVKTITFNRLLIIVCMALLSALFRL